MVMMSEVEDGEREMGNRYGVGLGAVNWFGEEGGCRGNEMR